MTELPPLVDLHNHLIPGVDDGAQSLDEALAGLSAMRDQGVRRIVATPHINASLTHTEGPLAERLDRIDAGWEVLRLAAAERFPDIELARGHEIMLDVPDVQLDDLRLRVSGGQSVLVELPRLFLPAGAAEALHRLRAAGWTPIVAHPERYVNINIATGDINVVAEWRRLGARMAVNAGSLVGGFGTGALTTAQEMLRRGWVDLIGSDYHCRPSRPLLLRRAYDELVEWGGNEQAELLLSINPGLAMDGAALLPVPPLTISEGLWERVRGIFSR